MIVNLQPHRVDLAPVSELRIDKKSFFPQAIFCLPHGQRIFHEFPTRSEKRIKIFLEFLGGNVCQRVIVCLAPLSFTQNIKRYGYHKSSLLISQGFG